MFFPLVLLLKQSLSQIFTYEKEFITSPSMRKQSLTCFDASSNSLYILAGLQDQETWFSDIWKFELSSGLWQAITSVNKGPGEFHSGHGLYINEEIYIAGIIQRSQITNQIWKFNLKKLTWSLVNTQGDWPGNFVHAAITSYEYTDYKYLAVVPAYETSETKYIYL